MPSGGKRPGAGRKPGSRNKSTIAIEDRAARVERVKSMGALDVARVCIAELFADGLYLEAGTLALRGADFFYQRYGRSDQVRANPHPDQGMLALYQPPQPEPVLGKKEQAQRDAESASVSSEWGGDLSHDRPN